MPITTSERILAATQPALLAAAAVLLMATDIVSTPAALVRPLVLCVALGFVVFAVLLAASRNWTLSAILASGLILFTFRLSVPGLVLIVIGLWWIMVVALRRRTGRRDASWAIPRFVSRSVGIFSIVLVGLTAWNLTQAYTNGQPPLNVPDFTAVGAGGPDMYLILLDGYPRADTLSETFGYDNGEFLEDLRGLGLRTSPGAQANYNKTWLTLASMLNGEYVDRLLDAEEVPDDPRLQVRWIQAMIQEAALIDSLRDRGYRIETVPSAFTSTALTSVDRYRDRGGLTELEVRLITASPWAVILRQPVLDAVVADQREGVVSVLDMVADLAEEPDDNPEFVFAHVHSPHTPFVLHPPETSPPTLPDCHPARCAFWSTAIEELGIEFAEFRQGLLLQLEELNRLTIASIRRIVEADPEAIIVLMSDHGIRYSLADLPEHYRILISARVPGEPALFREDESPINIVRLLLAHLGENIDARPYERWASDWGRNLLLERMEPER